MTKAPHSFAQQTARGLLYCLIFLIPFSVAAIEILFPILLLFWAAGWNVLGQRHSSLSVWRSKGSTRVFFPLLLYVTLCAWSVPLSSHPALSFEGLVFKTLEYALFFILASDVSAHPDVPRRSLWALKAAGWLVGLYAVLQEWAIFHAPYRQALDPIRGHRLNYIRMVGPYNNPNDLATFLMVASLILIAQIIFNGTSQDRNRSRADEWVLSVFLLGCLAWAQSRGALLGFSVGLAILLGLNRWHRRVWMGASAALVFTTLFLVFKRGNLIRLLTLSDVASIERRAMWHAAWGMIRQHPMVGVGLNAFMANYQAYALNPNEWPAYAHNCFLQIFAETGIFGLLAFLWFLWSLFALLVSTLHRAPNSFGRSARPWLAGLTAALAAFLVQSAFDTNLYSLRQATLFWTLSGLAFGTARLTDS